MNFFSSNAWIIVTFLLFTALVAIIASWKTKGDNLQTADGYFLASRSLSGIVIAGSLLLTNLSAEQLVGLNGQSWKSNMGPIAWEVGSLFTLLALAFFFLPKYLKMGATTMPQLMEERYDKQTKTIFSLVIVIMYSILNLPVILYSGAVVFENIFDISGLLGVSPFTAVAILCIIIGIIGGCYAIFGGLKAVAVSDTINGVGLIAAGFILPIIGFVALGKATGGTGFIDGIKYIIEADPTKLNAINAANAPEPEVPWPLLFTGMFFNNLYWWCTNQSFVQRSLAAKSLKEGQKGAIYCGLLKCLGPLYLVIPGIIAYHLPSVQDRIANLDPSVNAMDFAYPALIAEIVPRPVMGVIAAVVFGAILSSFNSVLNSAATMFTLDLYKSVFRPGKSDVYYVKVGKIYSTIAGAVSICVAPFVFYASSGITTLLNSLSQFVALPVLMTILGVLMFKRIPKFAPKLVTVFHVVTYAIFLLIKPNYPGTQEPIHYLYAVAVQFPIELFIMWACNKFAPTKEAFVIKDVKAVDLTPWKYRYIAAAIGIAIAVGIYILFSPLGIAA